MAFNITGGVGSRVCGGSSFKWKNNSQKLAMTTSTAYYSDSACTLPVYFTIAASASCNTQSTQTCVADTTSPGLFFTVKCDSSSALLATANSTTLIAQTLFGGSTSYYVAERFADASCGETAVSGFNAGLLGFCELTNSANITSGSVQFSVSATNVFIDAKCSGTARSTVPNGQCVALADGSSTIVVGIHKAPVSSTSTSTAPTLSLGSPTTSTATSTTTKPPEYYVSRFYLTDGCSNASIPKPAAISFDLVGYDPCKPHDCHLDSRTGEYLQVNCGATASDVSVMTNWFFGSNFTNPHISFQHFSDGVCNESSGFAAEAINLCQPLSGGGSYMYSLDYQYVVFNSSDCSFPTAGKYDLSKKAVGHK
ncbi:hypothetical protein HK100_001562 [Physocladia obscura]|uniref:Uncharacterized protein n=1 Tax=Physocladia obscura TaxID=109957 RepID=A0AAD5XG31_9FUNG|nr:hypothetical protein HK100_001562 [Physocladia obscura]